MGDIVITSSQCQLLLRPFRTSDAASLKSALRDSRVACGLPSFFRGPTAERSRSAWVMERLHHQLPSRMYAAVALSISEPPIGSITFDTETEELSYWIDGAHQSRGYGKEAVQQFCTRLTNSGSRLVRATTRVDNAASIRLLQSAGFSCAGYSRSERIPPTRRVRKFVKNLEQQRD